MSTQVSPGLYPGRNTMFPEGNEEVGQVRVGECRCVGGCRRMVVVELTSADLVGRSQEALERGCRIDRCAYRHRSQNIGCRSSGHSHSRCGAGFTHFRTSGQEQAHRSVLQYRSTGSCRSRKATTIRLYKDPLHCGILHHAQGLKPILNRFALRGRQVARNLRSVDRLDLLLFMRLSIVLEPELSDKGRLIRWLPHPQADLLLHVTSPHECPQAPQSEDDTLTRHRNARKHSIHRNTQIRHKALHDVRHRFELHLDTPTLGFWG